MIRAPSKPIPPRFVVQIILRLSHALIRMGQALLPPQLTLFDHIGGIGHTQLIHAAARWKIADLLHQQPMTADELAQRLKTHAEATHRMMRALVTLGVFKLGSDGKFRNNRLSEPLRTGSPGSMRDFADYFGSPSNVTAWSDVLTTVKSGTNAFERIHQMPIWQWFQKHPQEGQIFAEAMVNLTQLDAPVIAKTYPFSEIRSLCDVAGGRGTLLTEILHHHPHLNAVLFDESHILEKALSFLEQRGVAAVVERKSGNFFERVPRGHDAYLVKDILHDWDDERCIQILTNIRQAIAPKGRLLVAEVLVEKQTTQKPGPLMDVHMMTVCCEGRQRSRNEFKELFQKCGFKMNRVFSTPFPISIIEGIAQ
jgi:hypothetical protein